MEENTNLWSVVFVGCIAGAPFLNYTVKLSVHCQDVRDQYGEITHGNISNSAASNYPFNRRN